MFDSNWHQSVFEIRIVAISANASCSSLERRSPTVYVCSTTLHYTTLYLAQRVLPVNNVWNLTLAYKNSPNVSFSSGPMMIFSIIGLSLSSWLWCIPQVFGIGLLLSFTLEEFKLFFVNFTLRRNRFFLFLWDTIWFWIFVSNRWKICQKGPRHTFL